eukprot:COSAG05_NODE_10414_length_566_cov_1.850107_1_plen_105_part_01
MILAIRPSRYRYRTGSTVLEYSGTTCIYSTGIYETLLRRYLGTVYTGTYCTGTGTHWYLPLTGWPAKPEFRSAGPTSQQAARQPAGPQRLRAVALSAKARGTSER